MPSARESIFQEIDLFTPVQVKINLFGGKEEKKRFSVSESRIVSSDKESLASDFDASTFAFETSAFRAESEGRVSILPFEFGRRLMAKTLKCMEEYSNFEGRTENLKMRRCEESISEESDLERLPGVGPQRRLMTRRTAAQSPSSLHFSAVSVHVNGGLLVPAPVRDEACETVCTTPRMLVDEREDARRRRRETNPDEIGRSVDSNPSRDVHCNPPRGEEGRGRSQRRGGGVCT